jgi:hypothetical protein
MALEQFGEYLSRFNRRPPKATTESERERESKIRVGTYTQHSELSGDKKTSFMAGLSRSNGNILNALIKHISKTIQLIKKLFDVFIQQLFPTPCFSLSFAHTFFPTDGEEDGKRERERNVRCLITEA